MIIRNLQNRQDFNRLKCFRIKEKSLFRK